MKWPWTKRAEEAKMHAEEAKAKLDEVKERRSRVDAITSKAHQQLLENNISEKLSTLFSIGGDTRA